MNRPRTLMLLGISILALTLVQGVAAAAPVTLHIDADRRATTPASFIPGEAVSAWYNLPDGTSVYLGRTDALEDGSLDWTIDADTWNAIPVRATGIVATGQTSGEQAIYIYHRATGPLALTVAADGYASTGSGFAAGEMVGLWYNRADGTAVPFGRTDATADGSLSWTIDAADLAAIPADAINLVAQGQGSGLLAIYTFPR